MANSKLLGFYHDSHRDCRRSIVNLVDKDKLAKYLDCGCDDGGFTMQVSNAIGTKDIHGIEIEKVASLKAEEKGIKVDAADLNKKFPYQDNSFDAVTANQVIEHLYDTDLFVKEIHRILKPGGYAIISTNNLASWHNVIALLFGKQPFPSDVSNSSHAIGKLVALFDGEGGAWAHLRIFSYAALRDIFKYHNFEVEKMVGIGYYPLPTFIASRLAQIDKRHSAYLTIKVRKPLK